MRKKNEQKKTTLGLEVRGSPRTELTEVSVPREMTADDKKPEKLNTISYGFGSNSTIKDSYNNSKVSPMYT